MPRNSVYLFRRLVEPIEGGLEPSGSFIAGLRVGAEPIADNVANAPISECTEIVRERMPDNRRRPVERLVALVVRSVLEHVMEAIGQHICR